MLTLMDRTWDIGLKCILPEYSRYHLHQPALGSGSRTLLSPFQQLMLTLMDRTWDIGLKYILPQSRTFTNVLDVFHELSGPKGMF